MRMEREKSGFGRNYKDSLGKSRLERESNPSKVPPSSVEFVLIVHQATTAIHPPFPLSVYLYS